MFFFNSCPIFVKGMGWDQYPISLMLEPYKLFNHGWQRWAFTRAHAQLLKNKLNSSRIFHEQNNQQLISQRTFMLQQSEVNPVISDQLSRITANGVRAPKYNVKFDTFSFESPLNLNLTILNKMSRWCWHLAVFKYQVPDVCSATLWQLRGRADDIGCSLIGKENTCWSGWIHVEIKKSFCLSCPSGKGKSCLSDQNTKTPRNHHWLSYLLFSIVR